MVPAKALMNDTNICQQRGDWVTYHHIMFDAHQIVYAEGAATESFYPGGVGMIALVQETRAELIELFPQLEREPATYGPSCWPELQGNAVQVLLSA